MFGRVSLSAGKKNLFPIEAWTDAVCLLICINLRHFTRSAVTSHKDLAIYMDLIRSLLERWGKLVSL